MIANKIITKRILGLLFGLAILFPTAIQFEHVFEEHHHVVCKEVKTHLHESKTDCSLCDFHFSSFHFTAVAPIEFLVTEVIITFEPQSISSEKSSHPTTNHLRGPPIIS